MKFCNHPISTKGRLLEPCRICNPEYRYKDKMKKESLKDWCKEWTVTNIAEHIFCNGMRFLAEKDDKESKMIQDEKWILIKELKRRIE